MTAPSKTIHNSKTGMAYKLLRVGRETEGQLLEMEVTYRPRSDEPPAHYHPLQTEHFKLLSGEMILRLRGELRHMRAGDTVSVPPNTVHSRWNNGERPAVLHWVVTPALDTEQLIETLAALANGGRTDERGVPASCNPR